MTRYLNTVRKLQNSRYRARRLSLLLISLESIKLSGLFYCRNDAIQTKENRAAIRDARTSLMLGIALSIRHWRGRISIVVEAETLSMSFNLIIGLLQLSALSCWLMLRFRFQKNSLFLGPGLTFVIWKRLFADCA